MDKLVCCGVEIKAGHSYYIQFETGNQQLLKWQKITVDIVDGEFIYGYFPDGCVFSNYLVCGSFIKSRSGRSVTPYKVKPV